MKFKTKSFEEIYFSLRKNKTFRKDEKNSQQF